MDPYLSELSVSSFEDVDDGCEAQLLHFSKEVHQLFRVSKGGSSESREFFCGYP
jgi:hypothetical protein